MRLAHQYPAEFAKLLDEEREALGLPLRQSRPRIRAVGTRACYHTGCDHPECSKANRDYQREYMKTWRRGKSEEVIPWDDNW